MTVLGLGFDLFFKPQLMAAAEAANVQMVFASAADAPARAAEAARVLADVSAPGVLDALEAIRKAHPDVPVLVCYPHVQQALADRAEALGARTVTRGQFNARLADAVRGAL